VSNGFAQFSESIRLIRERNATEFVMYIPAMVGAPGLEPGTR